MAVCCVSEGIAECGPGSARSPGRRVPQVAVGKGKRQLGTRIPVPAGFLSENRPHHDRAACNRLFSDTIGV